MPKYQLETLQHNRTQSGGSRMGLHCRCSAPPYQRLPRSALGIRGLHQGHSEIKNLTERRSKPAPLTLRHPTPPFEAQQLPQLRGFYRINRQSAASLMFSHVILPARAQQELAPPKDLPNCCGLPIMAACPWQRCPADRGVRKCTETFGPMERLWSSELVLWSWNTVISA